MPLDNEIAKERVWKEHCEKLVMQSIRFRQEGRSHAEFTINPYHLQQTKPVTEPVSIRAKDFLDRPKATLEAISGRLAASGLDPHSSNPPEGFSESSPRNVAHINKARAVKGNNIFGTTGQTAEMKRKLFEDWSEVLNGELGGGKSYHAAHDASGFLPAIGSKLSGSQSSGVSPLSPSKLVSPTKSHKSGEGASSTFSASPQRTSRDEVVQELLLRSTKPPTSKYSRPQTESQVLGWEAEKAQKANPMFTFLHKSCDMTRFAAESGHSPTKKKP